MFRSPFVAIFREVLLKIYYKENLDRVQLKYNDSKNHLPEDCHKR